MTLFVLMLLLPVLVVDGWFLLQLLAGLPRSGSSRDALVPVRAAILVPAHNEAQGISATIRRLQSSARSFHRVLVVADNCYDETAALARAEGCEVIERTDPRQRGKGYALAFGRDWLRSSPPACVVVVDADCRIDSQSLDRLSAAAAQSGRPCQAINLLSPVKGGSSLVQISAFAFLIKNLIRQRAMQRLTGRVHLTGTGMAMPWALFDQAALATADIVEDMRLGIELARGGKAPQLVEDAFVWSPHAAREDTLQQRSRWEGGFLSLARSLAPELLIEGLKKRSWQSLLAGLDLLIPPVALLVLLNAFLLGLTVVLAVADLISWAPAALLTLAGGLIGLLLLAAWWREGRAFLSAASLAGLPFYALWKIPMYLGLLLKGAPSVWQRTRRSQGADPR